MNKDWKQRQESAEGIRSRNLGEEKKKEIETIRERKITVNLSDADCDRLARKCGEHGLTIGELIENFIPMEVMKECMPTNGLTIVCLECSQSRHFLIICFVGDMPQRTIWTQRTM